VSQPHQLLVKHNNTEQALKPAGRLKFFAHEWEKITSDKTILSYVQGCKIEFDTEPLQTAQPRAIPFSVKETQVLDSEIEKLLDKGVIHCSNDEQGQFISNIFVRPKKNGSYRLILNLKLLNEEVDYHHFKMDTIYTCVLLMTKNCYMASLDLKDAYYSVPIHPNHQKKLKFIWNDKLYQFTCLPNGLACAPRMFTKLLKPVFANLRKKGHTSSPYLDDSFLVADTYQACVANVQATLEFFNKLGFVVHPDKSQLQPTHIIEHLGFVFNSTNMTIKVNKEKITKLRNCATLILRKKKLTIRQVAQLIGVMVSCFPGVEFGQLYYRRLEMHKADCLKIEKGNFEANMTLTAATRQDISWWIDNVGQGKKVSQGTPTFDLKTDASFSGWGAVTDSSKTGGRWDPSELELSINVLELKAVLFGLKSLCVDMGYTHIKVLTDNTTAVAYINHMGGSQSPPCNDVARDIWTWCQSKNIWVTATHIPGKENVEADRESRVFSDTTEWQLCPQMFESICDRFGKPDIDLFASRTNFQCKPYIAWKPDPEAKAINAFTLHWGKFTNLYVFPPFSLLTRVLQKMWEDNASGIVVAPDWPTQPWYSKLIQMSKAKPMLLPVLPSTLTLPHKPGVLHPLHRKLQLMAWRL